MKVLCIFLACVAVSSAEVSRVIGGTTTSINLVPYQLGLWISNEFKCGAVLISTKAALTAAQCVYSVTPSEIRVRAGSTIMSMGTDYNASSVTIHPSYSRTTYDYDIAVLKFNPAIELTENVGVVILPSVGETVAAGSPADVTGWGVLTETGTTLAGSIQTTVVPVVPTSVCSSALSRINSITERMICAGYTTKGTGFCAGDTGGPLVYAGKLIGLASWGERCGAIGSPGVYTKVSALRGWISTEAGV